MSSPPSQLPMGIFEQYVTPHARFPLANPVIAAELLSFRLKSGKSKASSGGGGSSSSSSSRKQPAVVGTRSGKLVFDGDEGAMCFTQRACYIPSPSTQLVHVLACGPMV